LLAHVISAPFVPLWRNRTGFSAAYFFAARASLIQAMTCLTLALMPA
jgi:hypothetical protein